MPTSQTVTRTHHGVASTDVALIVIRDGDTSRYEDSSYDLTTGPGRVGLDDITLAGSTGFDGSFDVVTVTDADGETVGIEVIVDVAEANQASRAIPNPLTEDERRTYYAGNAPEDLLSRALAHDTECDEAWSKTREQHLLTDPALANTPIVLGPIQFPSGTVRFDGPATFGPVAVPVTGDDWIAVRWHERQDVDTEAMAAITGDTHRDTTRIGVYRAAHAPEAT